MSSLPGPNLKVTELSLHAARRKFPEEGEQIPTITLLWSFNIVLPLKSWKETGKC